MHAINRISELITGNSVMFQINEIFSSLNNVGVSFPLLLSCAAIYKHLYCKRFPVLASLTDSKLWTLPLFKQMEVGVCYLQVNLQQSLGVCAHHTIAVSIVK